MGSEHFSLGPELKGLRAAVSISQRPPCARYPTRNHPQVSALFLMPTKVRGSSQIQQPRCHESVFQRWIGWVHLPLFVFNSSRIFCNQACPEHCLPLKFYYRSQRTCLGSTIYWVLTVNRAQWEVKEPSESSDRGPCHTTAWQYTQEMCIVQALSWGSALHRKATWKQCSGKARRRLSWKQSSHWKGSRYFRGEAELPSGDLPTQCSEESRLFQPPTCGPETFSVFWLSKGNLNFYPAISSCHSYFLRSWNICSAD